MTLTLAAAAFLGALALILFLVEVAVRVWTGQWPAEKVIAVAVAVPLVALIGAMAWRWEA
jgi:hypothetical protein